MADITYYEEKKQYKPLKHDVARCVSVDFEEFCDSFGLTINELNKDDVRNNEIRNPVLFISRGNGVLKLGRCMYVKCDIPKSIYSRLLLSETIDGHIECIDEYFSFNVSVEKVMRLPPVIDYDWQEDEGPRRHRRHRRGKGRGDADVPKPNGVDPLAADNFSNPFGHFSDMSTAPSSPSDELDEVDNLIVYIEEDNEKIRRESSHTMPSTATAFNNAECGKSGVKADNLPGMVFSSWLDSVNGKVLFNYSKGDSKFSLVNYNDAFFLVSFFESEEDEWFVGDDVKILQRPTEWLSRQGNVRSPFHAIALASEYLQEKFQLKAWPMVIMGDNITIVNLGKVLNTWDTLGVKACYCRRFGTDIPSFRWYMTERRSYFESYRHLIPSQEKKLLDLMKKFAVDN